jgi:hypothetical protein
MSRLKRTFSLDDFEHVNLYDSWRVRGYEHSSDPFAYSINIFGNANIGNAHLTNLQVPGTALYQSDECVVVQRWYARTDARITETFMRWANSVQVTMRVSMKYRWMLSLYELLERRPRYTPHDARIDPMPMVLMPREDFGATVAVFMHELSTSMWSEQQEQQDSNPRVWIHLEGVKAPAPLLQPFIDDLQAAMKIDDERAARYILAHITPDSGDDEKTQLQAIADGFLEQRHRT